MRTDANKPLFIITPVGEFGPFTADEILRQVSKGEILRTDRLRTSDGQLIGTVSDIESGRIRVVMAAEARPGSDPTAKRASSSPRVTPASGRLVRSAAGPSWVVGGVLAGVSLVIVAAVIWSGSPRPKAAAVASPAGPAPVASAQALPRISLSVGERRPGSVDVNVVSDRRLNGPLTVRVGLIGDAGGVRLEPADGRVQLAAGGVARFVVSAQGDEAGARKVRMLLATSDGYDAAGSGTLDLVVEPAPPLVVKPTIAWESFAYDDLRALQLGEGSHGWGKWAPLGLQVVDKPLPVPAGFTGAPPPARHAVALSQDNKASYSLRGLTQRIATGTVWISCLVQGQRRSDGETDWASLAFEDRGKNGFSIAPQNATGRSLWHINVPQADDTKGRPRLQLSRAADIAIPIRMVVRLDMGASSSDLSYWIDPPPGHEPKPMPTDQLLATPPIGFDRVSVYASKNTALHVSDLRIGRTWQEVLPGR